MVFMSIRWRRTFCDLYTECVASLMLTATRLHRTSICRFSCGMPKCTDRRVIVRMIREVSAPHSINNTPVRTSKSALRRSVVNVIVLFIM
ncbi:unknown [Prevotella sp. CAG:873]|nr:unknown [Prevotella sp. CAG:873]